MVCENVVVESYATKNEGVRQKIKSDLPGAAGQVPSTRNSSLVQWKPSLDTSSMAFFMLPETGARMTTDSRNDLGKILKQRRVMIPLTLQELSHAAGVSASHLGRIERGKRFPSAYILRRIAKPLGFKESELFTLANYLSPQ